jgi:hypothetical protein
MPAVQVRSHVMLVVEVRRRLQPIRRFTCLPCVLSIIRIRKRKCIVVNSAKHLEKIKWLFTHISSDQVRVVRVFFLNWDLGGRLHPSASYHMRASLICQFWTYRSHLFVFYTKGWASAPLKIASTLALLVERFFWWNWKGRSQGGRLRAWPPMLPHTTA